MNMARTARAAGDSGICHVMLRGSPTKDIRRRRVMLTENRPLFTFVGDRYYGVMNVIANMLHRNIHFLFRCKDISSNGFAAAFGLPDTSFDIQITKTLTKSKKKAFRNDPNFYIDKGNSIDLLDSDHPFLKISFRLVRFRIPNSDRFELIATDLPADSYSAAAIADIYHARWGIETSFRSPLKSNHITDVL